LPCGGGGGGGTTEEDSGFSCDEEAREDDNLEPNDSGGSFVTVEGRRIAASVGSRPVEAEDGADDDNKLGRVDGGTRQWPALLTVLLLLLLSERGGRRSASSFTS
jgi:hypothetical protein